MEEIFDTCNIKSERQDYVFTTDVDQLPEDEEQQ